MSLRKNCEDCGFPMSKTMYDNGECPNCKKENFSGFPALKVPTSFFVQGKEQKRNEGMRSSHCFTEGEVQVLV